LTGKVVTTVTRAVPVPFNAVVDEVLVKPGEAIDKGAPLMRYHLQEEAERVLQREVTTGAATEDLKGQVLDLERRLAETSAQRNKARQLAASGLGSAQASTRLEDDVHSLQRRIDLLRVTIQKSEKKLHRAARGAERVLWHHHQGRRTPALLVDAGLAHRRICAFAGRHAQSWFAACRRDHACPCGSA